MSDNRNWIIPGEDLDQSLLDETGSSEDTIVTLENELCVAGVEECYARLFSIYLYSAFLIKLPLILCGPNGEAIINALSASVFGKTAAVIDVGRYESNNLKQDINELDDNILCIKNVLNGNMITDLIECLSLDKHIFAVVPFYEDLFVEPVGLFDYFYPVITKNIIGSPPGNMVGGKGNATYKAFSIPGISSKKYLQEFKSRNLSLITAKSLSKIQALIKEKYPDDFINIKSLFIDFPFLFLTKNGELELLAEREISGDVSEIIRLYCD